MYIQCGYNRFKIASYMMHDDGYMLLVTDEEASNPSVEHVVPPKEIA